MTAVPLLTQEIATPLGPMLAMAEARGLCMLDFADREGLQIAVKNYTQRFGYTQASGKNAIHALLKKELKAYFEGQQHEFSVPLCLQGTTFQKQVWNALLRLPFAETRTYGGFAKSLGKPKASRAVGRANGLNPISIVVPCHRLIGSDGSLTGYGGGQQRKAALLALENNNA
jgi:AraC family transcriptional regulator of adaptative response/methylated-DNA-[protein]-cysteine methyltransferase